MTGGLRKSSARNFNAIRGDRINSAHCSIKSLLGAVKICQNLKPNIEIGTPGRACENSRQGGAAIPQGLYEVVVYAPRSSLRPMYEKK